MARTIQEIKAQMDAQQALQSDLSGLNSTSQTSIYNLWKYITAVVIFLHESLWDLFKQELETTIADAPVGTDNWVQQMAFKFQYSSTDPQVIEINDNFAVASPPPFVPSYPVVDETLRIITRASVKTLPNRIVSVKVAKSEPPQALSAPELNSFKGYLNDISFAGVQYNAVSLDSDKVMIKANIYYDGQYTSTISASTITSINNFLAAIPFDGVFRLSSLENAILSTPGVKDVFISDVSVRPDTVVFSAITNSNYLVKTSTELTNKLNLYSGYVTEETTGGETFADRLNFIIE
jgi:hypothetical protein